MAVSSVEHPDFGYSIFAWARLEWEDYRFLRQSIAVLKGVMGWIESTRNSHLCGNSERDLVWNEALCKYSQAEVIWVRADWSLRRGKDPESLWNTRRQTVKSEQRPDWWQLQAGNSGAGRAAWGTAAVHGRIPPSCLHLFRGAQPCPHHLGSGLLACRLRINPCYCKPPCWWSLATAALGN